MAAQPHLWSPRPPRLSELPLVPVTGALCACASVISVIWWLGYEFSAFFVSSAAWEQPWSFFLSALPHVDAIHLIFNVYWTWTLGGVIERSFGSMRTAGLVVMLAGTSAIAEHGFSTGGVGLSGIVYGLFTLLWVLSRRDERFAPRLGRYVITLFVAWFFLCIVLTETEIWPVGNFAHAGGAAMGVLLGCVMTTRARKQLLTAAATAAFCAGLIVASTVARPYVNADSVAFDLADRAYDAIIDENYAAAVDLSEQAIALGANDFHIWLNYGLALFESGDIESARRAFTSACAIDGSDRYALEMLNHCTALLAHAAFEAGDFHRAETLFQACVHLTPQDARSWFNHGTALQSLGRIDDAEAMYHRALELNPQLEEARCALRLLESD